MEYPITISRSKHHKAALSVVNCFLKLTDFELNLIVAILDNGMTNLDTNSRRILRSQLNTDTYTFNNYIKRLKERGYLVDTTEGLQLESRLIKAANDTEIIVKFDVN